MEMIFKNIREVSGSETNTCKLWDSELYFVICNVSAILIFLLRCPDLTGGGIPSASILCSGHIFKTFWNTVQEWPVT